MENKTASQVTQLQSEGNKLLVCYTATWCNVCKLLIPRLDTISTNYPSVKFVQVDVDQNKELVNSLNIQTVPTVMIYNGTTLINRSLGSNVDSVYTKLLDTL